MKSVIRIAVVIGVFSISFFACSKKDNPAPALAADGTLIATLDGVSFKSATAAAAVVSGTTTITGIDANNKVIVISILGTTAGTFDVTGTTGAFPVAIVAVTPDGEDTYSSTYYDGSAKVGSVIITSVDATAKTISGTFVSKVKRLVPTTTEIDITLGSFTKIPYTTSQTSSNAFSLKLNGTAITGFDFINGAKLSGSIQLGATSGQSTYLVVIPANATVGDHDFGSIGSDYYAAITNTGTSSYLVSTSGTITITKFNSATKQVEASFGFQASPLLGGDAVSVTEGALAITWD